jgi:hypothetical protein
LVEVHIFDENQENDCRVCANDVSGEEFAHKMSEGYAPDVHNKSVEEESIEEGFLGPRVREEVTT